MNSSFEIASHLLAIDTRKGTAEKGKVRAHPLMFAVVNLFFCAYMDRYLRDDASGHYFQLFVLVEVSVMVLLTVGIFMRSSSTVIMKSSLFPLTPLSRLYFTFMSTVLRPIAVAFWATTLLFVLVVFRDSWMLAFTAIGFYLLLITSIQTVTCVLCLKLLKSSEPVAAFGVLCIAAILFIMTSSIVFKFDTLLNSTPMISWCVSGILAAKRGEVLPSLLNAGLLCAVLLMAMMFGRKVA